MDTQVRRRLAHQHLVDESRQLAALALATAFSGEETGGVEAGAWDTHSPVSAHRSPHTGVQSARHQHLVDETRQLAALSTAFSGDETGGVDACAWDTHSTVSATQVRHIPGAHTAAPAPRR